MSQAHSASGQPLNFWGLYIYTLPETNISPENRPLEKEIPVENHDLAVSFRECNRKNQRLNFYFMARNGGVSRYMINNQLSFYIYTTFGLELGGSCETLGFQIFLGWIFESAA